jgi:hypothetical protein
MLAVTSVKYIVDVREEFEVLNWQQLVNAREILFPDAPPFPEGTRTALSGTTIPELNRAISAGQVHKKVVSWDEENLAAVGFGSYVGDLRSEEGDAMMRDRKASDHGAIRISQFAQEEGDEGPMARMPSQRLFHRKGLGTEHSIATL